MLKKEKSLCESQSDITLLIELDLSGVQARSNYNCQKNNFVSNLQTLF